MKNRRAAWDRVAVVAIGLLGVTTMAWGATARTWVIEGREAFLAGTMEGAAVTASGAVTVGPAVEHQFTDADPRLWSAAVAADGTVYVAAGESGQVWRVDMDGTAAEHFSLDEGLAQTLSAVADGGLAIGASQPGRVVTLDGTGAVTGTTSLEAGYVWDLLEGTDGALWVATGEPAAVWRIEPGVAPVRAYSAPDEHVRRLALGADGEVYAGTVGQGLVVRIRGAADAFVLHDTPFGEVTGLGWAQGALWVAGNSGGAAPNGGGASGQGSVMRLDAAGGADASWDLDESVHSLGAIGNRVLVGTGQNGRVYEMESTGLRLIADLPSGQVGAVLNGDDAPIAMGSNPAGIYRFGRDPQASASYRSAVRDAGTIARWGQLEFATMGNDGRTLNAGVEVFVRTGNTAEPGDSWSDWSGPFSADTSSVAVPAARYAQLRVDLQAGTDIPHLRRVALVYVPNNSRPVVESLRAHPAGVVYRENASFEDGLPFAQLPAIVESRLNDQDPNAAAANAAGGSFRGRPLFVAGQQTLTWEAEDPDGDALRQSLEIREEGTVAWKPLAEEIEGDTYVFDTARVRDGRYEARLVVDDLPDNAAADALDATSNAVGFLVDNSPPAITDLAVSVADGGSYRISGVATDQSSIVLRIRYSVDGRDWRTVLPADGAADSTTEAFEFEVDGDAATVVIQVTDGAMNRGADQVTVG